MNFDALVSFPADVPDTPLLRELREAHDAEDDTVLRAHLAAVARRAIKSEQYARYQLARYRQEKATPSGDWHWRWWAEVDAYGGDAQAAFYARWLTTSQAFPDAESAYRLAALRRCAETTPTWAARELDGFWGG